MLAAESLFDQLVPQEWQLVVALAIAVAVYLWLVSWYEK